MVPGSDWKGKAEANSRPKSRGSGGGSEWGRASPQACPPGRVVSRQGRALSRSPRLPQGGPPHPCSSAGGSSSAHGPVQAGYKASQAGKLGTVCTSPGFPLKPGDVETLFKGVTTSKGQGSNWDPGSLGRNCHTSSSFWHPSVQYNQSHQPREASKI